MGSACSGAAVGERGGKDEARAGPTSGRAVGSTHARAFPPWPHVRADPPVPPTYPGTAESDDPAFYSVLSSGCTLELLKTLLKKSR